MLLSRDAACRVSPATTAAATRDVASHVSTGNSQSVLARRGGAIIKKSSCEQTVLMKSRIFLLLVAFNILAGSLIGQTAPPASTPAAPTAASTPSTPLSAKSTPKAQTPAGQAPAQPGNPAKSDPAKSDADESVATIVHVVNEVRVVFTVTDRHGRYIKDLKRDDFRVIDDQKPAELRSFRSETDLPLQVGLLVDASNSVRDRFKFEQEAAIEFLNAIVRPRYDKAFVVGFDATPEVTQDFTDNTEGLSAGVRMLRAGGGTAMYDALYFACRDKLLKQEQVGPVRRAIILLSDGEDNLSHVTREEAIDMAARAEVIVYTISTNISGMKGKGDKVLERIADATGGRAFFPFQMRDVSDAFLSIQEELRSQYAVAYKPADFAADGRYRTIAILAQDKGMKVRTRKGYYAPKQ
jgi:Ca-activated chloride channel homolog